MSLDWILIGMVGLTGLLGMAPRVWLKRVVGERVPHQIAYAVLLLGFAAAAGCLLLTRGDSEYLFALAPVLVLAGTVLAGVRPSTPKVVGAGGFHMLRRNTANLGEVATAPPSVKLNVPSGTIKYHARWLALVLGAVVVSFGAGLEPPAGLLPFLYGFSGALMAAAIAAEVIERSASANVVNANALCSEIVRLRVSELTPKFLFYFSAPNAGPIGQILMWLPYMARIDEPFYIMVRERKIRDALAKHVKDIPIIVAEKLADVERFLVPSVNVVFYANNGTKNTHMVRFSSCWHVQMLHGDSEKPPSYNPVSKMYDKLFVAGQRAIDRYAENGVSVAREQFEIIGRPQTDAIIEQVRSGRSPDSEVTVLIAPTWLGYHEDAQFSSLMLQPTFVRLLLDSEVARFRIIFRPHPQSLDGNPDNVRMLKSIRTMLKSKGNHVYNSGNDIVDEFNEADILVADISSVPIDFLASRKPIIHVDPGSFAELKDDCRFSRYLDATYIVKSKFTNLDAVLAAVVHEDPKAELREKIARHYLGDNIGASADRFVEVARTLLESRKPKGVQ